jgi:hypothetical protein
MSLSTTAYLSPDGTEIRIVCLDCEAPMYFATIEDALLAAPFPTFGTV